MSAEGILFSTSPACCSSSVACRRREPLHLAPNSSLLIAVVAILALMNWKPGA